MPVAALALVLVAALLHAGWNLLAKRDGGGRHFVFITALLTSLLWAPAGGYFLLRDHAQLTGWAWLFLVGSGLIHLVYFQVLLTGYRLADLTVVYPLARGSGPVVSSLGAAILLGEELDGYSVAGLAGVTVGIFLIAGGPALFTQAGVPEARARRAAGVRWGLLTGLFIAGYTVLDGYAVKVLLLAPVLVDYVGNCLRVVFLLPSALADRDGLRTEWRAVRASAFVIAAVSPLGYVLVLYAARMAPLSHVAPAREISMLFAAILGGRLLGEGDQTLRILGAASMALGVMLLALG